MTSDGAGAPSSKAPTSDADPYGRWTPRWSVEGARAAGTQSMAGLSEANAIVKVQPPLLASGSNFGFVKLKLVPLLKFAEPSDDMLYPPSIICPHTLLLVPASSEFFKVMEKFVAASIFIPKDGTGLPKGAGTFTLLEASVTFTSIGMPAMTLIAPPRASPDGEPKPPAAPP